MDIDFRAGRNAGMHDARAHVHLSSARLATFPTAYQAGYQIGQCTL